MCHVLSSSLSTFFLRQRRRWQRRPRRWMVLCMQNIRFPFPFSLPPYTHTHTHTQRLEKTLAIAWVGMVLRVTLRLNCQASLLLLLLPPPPPFRISSWSSRKQNGTHETTFLPPILLFFAPFKNLKFNFKKIFICCHFKLKQQLFDGGNVTLSQLDVTLTPEDDGKKLVCRAENAHLGPASAVEDSWMLDVYCKSSDYYLVGQLRNNVLLCPIA